MYQNFKKQSGSINNLDEVIDAFDLPSYSPDVLLVNNNPVAEINTNTFEVKFVNEDSRKEFEKEAKSSGLLEQMKYELELDEIPENLLAITAANQSLDEVKSIYEEERKNKNSLLSFIDNLVSSNKESQANKLENHRNNLKRKETSKYRRI